MIRVRQIKVPVLKDSPEYLQKKVAQKLQIPFSEIEDIKINKKSLDARDKKQIYFVYEIDLEVKNAELMEKKWNSEDILVVLNEEYQMAQSGNEELLNRIVVVGSGPAGLFTAYMLAWAGYKPLVIERGKKVEERSIDVEDFWQTGKLNVNSNVQFGEGGAGTFSDGKLNTLVKDKRHLGKKVLEILVECGAPAEIMYEYNPHIGTDILRKVVVNMRKKIIEMGGEIRYQTQLTDLVIKNGKLEQIIVNDNEKIACNVLVLAIGHSARDTFYMLKEHDLAMINKPFAVGIRIMHKQEDINVNQFGKYSKFLGNASYKVTYTTKEKRGVYSFCMCPGGYVVNASSEQKRLAINGMSYYKRDSGIANSAIVITVSPEDYPDYLLAGVEFQRDLEAKVWGLCQGKIPVQLWQDFKMNRKSQRIGEIMPKMKGNYELANLRGILPDFMVQALLEAIPEFGKKIKVFDADDVVLAAIESRTSSRIRIIRDDSYESNVKGIYPCGEGAGYAGGITTSAIDGIQVAENIIKRFKRP